MTLGEKLARLRKARGMSQEQLAAALGVSRQAVSKWGLGEAVPDVSRVVAMSELFGVTTDYLLKDVSEEAGQAAGSVGEGNAGFAAGEAGGEASSAPDRNEKRWLGMTVALLAGMAILVMWGGTGVQGHQLHYVKWLCGQWFFWISGIQREGAAGCPAAGAVPGRRHPSAAGEAIPVLYFSTFFLESRILLVRWRE